MLNNMPSVNTRTPDIEHEMSTADDKSNVGRRNNSVITSCAKLFLVT